MQWRVFSKGSSSEKVQYQFECTMLTYFPSLGFLKHVPNLSLFKVNPCVLWTSRLLRISILVDIDTTNSFITRVEHLIFQLMVAKHR